MMKDLKNIDTIIFDFGGVIINIDFEATWNAFRGIGIDNLHEKFTKGKQSRLFDRFETGAISPDKFRTELCNMFQLEINQEIFDQCWNAMILDIPEDRIEMLKRLRKDFKVFLLSNSNKIHYDYYVQSLMQKYGFDNFDALFDGVYFSFNTGLIKPDKISYQKVISENNLDLDKTVFIDDSLLNITGAKAIGLQTIHLENTDISDVIKEIENKE